MSGSVISHDRILAMKAIFMLFNISHDGSFCQILHLLHSTLDIQQLQVFVPTDA